MTPIESNRRDEQEFEEWWEKHGLNAEMVDKHSYQIAHSWAIEAYMCSKEAERARASGLVEAIKKQIEDSYDEVSCYHLMFIEEALNEYNQHAKGE